jgi:hypothetical protein
VKDFVREYETVIDAPVHAPSITVVTRTTSSLAGLN